MLQGTASDATLISLLSAKAKTVKTLRAQTHQSIDESNIFGKLVAYTSSITSTIK
jgi:hypothetical protein